MKCVEKLFWRNLMKTIIIKASLIALFDDCFFLSFCGNQKSFAGGKQTPMNWNRDLNDERKCSHWVFIEKTKATRQRRTSFMACLFLMGKTKPLFIRMITLYGRQPAAGKEKERDKSNDVSGRKEMGTCQRDIKPGGKERSQSFCHSIWDPEGETHHNHLIMQQKKKAFHSFFLSTETKTFCYLVAISSRVYSRSESPWSAVNVWACVRSLYPFYAIVKWSGERGASLDGIPRKKGTDVKEGRRNCRTIGAKQP